MNSITLQTNDTIVVSGDLLGQLQFAAPTESDGGAATAVSAKISAIGEGAFQSSSHPAAIVFSTSTTDSNPVSDRLKVSHAGHFIPLANEQYDLGENAYKFNNLYVAGINANLTLSDLDGPIVTECRNDSGSDITKGTPVYIAGYYSSNGKFLIAPADAGDSSKMPAIGILENTILNGNEGYVHCFGLTTGINTGSFSVGNTVYVADGGGLTSTRPTSPDVLVQNIGRVLRSDASQGRILVLGPGRTNDVPNSGNFDILSVTNSITAGSFVKSGGTSSQFLKADGSTDSNTYLTAHPTISAATSVDNSNGNVIQDITLDSNGHITALGSVDLDGRYYTETEIDNFNYVDGNGTASYLPKWSDTDTLTNSIIYDNGTNIGIGQTSPSYKLEINGNIGLTSDGFYASPTGVMVGTNGWLYNDGQIAVSHGRFSSNGDAQNSTYILRGSTSNATFTTIQNNGSNVVLASNRTMMFTANIVGRSTNSADNAAYKLEGVLYNDGYGASIIGTPVKTIVGETDSSWDVQATVSGAGAGGSDYLNIQVKGATSKDVNWVAKLELLEVGGDITGYTEANILGGNPRLIP